MVRASVLGATEATGRVGGVSVAEGDGIDAGSAAGTEAGRIVTDREGEGRGVIAEERGVQGPELQETEGVVSVTEAPGLGYSFHPRREWGRPPTPEPRAPVTLCR